MIIQQHVLKPALSDVGRFIENKVTLPVLANVKLECHDNTLKLVGTDLEAFCIKTVQCSTSDGESWETTAPFSLFNEYIGSLSGEIEIINQATSIKIKCGTTETTIKTVDANEYPLLPTLLDVEPLTFESADLVKQLSSVVFAAATDENRPILTGVFLKSDGKKLSAASADGYRMAIYTVERKGDEFAMVVPAKFINALLGIIGDEKQTIKVYYSGNQAIFDLSDTVLVSQLIEGHFPDIMQIVPKNHSVSVVVSQKDLYRKTKQLGIIAKSSDNTVKISYGEKSVTLSAHGVDIGDSEAVIEAKVDGERFESAINYNYLVQALSTMSGNVVVEQLDKAHPFKLYPENDLSNLQVIMPLHIKEGS